MPGNQWKSLVKPVKPHGAARYVAAAPISIFKSSMVHTDGATSLIKARKGRPDSGQSLVRAISYYDGCHQIQAGDEPANAALQPCSQDG